MMILSLLVAFLCTNASGIIAGQLISPAIKSVVAAPPQPIVNGQLTQEKVEVKSPVVPDFFAFNNMRNNYSIYFSSQNIDNNVTLAALNRTEIDVDLNNSKTTTSEILMKTDTKTSENDLETSFQIASVENFNTNNISHLETLSGLSQMIKHMILRYFEGNFTTLVINLKRNNIFESILPNRAMSPIDFKVFVKSLPPISEIDFQKALIEFSVNTHNCQFDTNSSGKVTCEENVTKNAKSLLRIADFWIQLPKLHLIEDCTKPTVMKIVFSPSLLNPKTGIYRKIIIQNETNAISKSIKSESIQPPTNHFQIVLEPSDSFTGIYHFQYINDTNYQESEQSKETQQLPFPI